MLYYIILYMDRVQQPHHDVTGMMDRLGATISQWCHLVNHCSFCIHMYDIYILCLFIY